jgi:hypothetical protein
VLQVEPTEEHSAANAAILSCPPPAAASAAALAAAPALLCDSTCASVCCKLTSWSRCAFAFAAAEKASRRALDSSRFLLFNTTRGSSTVASDA